MHRIVAILAGWALVTAVSAAEPQTAAPGLRMDSGIYLGAGVGRSEARICQLVGGSCDSKDLTWNAFVGYQITRHWAVELGYADLGDATTSGFTGGGAAQRLRMNTKTLELVGLGILPLGDRFAVYGKAGFFRYDSDGEATGAVVASASDKGTELTFGVGGEYHFDGRITVRVEWQRYLSVGSGVLGIDKADISAVRAGVRYRF